MGTLDAVYVSMGWRPHIVMGTGGASMGWSVPGLTRAAGWQLAVATDLSREGWGRGTLS